MDPKEVIADIIQSEGGLCVLDKIYLPIPHKNDIPAVKFGLGAELFMPDIDRIELRERVVRFMVDYCKTFPNKIDRYMPPGKDHSVIISGDLESNFTADFDSIPIQDNCGSILLGALDIGLKKDNIANYQAHALVNRPREHELSFVSSTFPVCNDAGQPDFDNLLSAVLRWCKICQPAHGCAGFTFIFLSKQNSVYAMQMIKRFPGFDFQGSVSFIMETESVHNRIKSVNWLTVLCDALVDELGGLDAMRSALEPVCKIHKYSGGVVIQAGAFPQVCDTYRNDVPEAYRLVARYTKSIRFESYGGGLFRVPHNLDKGEETQVWIRRFD
jgi:hypothetical protein